MTVCTSVRFAPRGQAERVPGGVGEDRAQVIALGLILAGYEAATSRDSWRNVTLGTTRYLTFLASNGYDLAPVEQRAAGQQPDTAA